MSTGFRVAGTLAALFLFSTLAAPQGAEPAFEVASIKRDVSGRPGPQYRMFPGLSVERATVKDLVTLAFGVHDFQISGGPGWIGSDRYNIEAKAEGNAVFSQEFRALQLRRLQTLLRDRFQLKVHREAKELPVYEVIVAKGGHKLQPPSCIERPFGDFTTAPGKTPIDYCGFGGFVRRGLYQASDGSPGDLAGALSLVLGRSVVDKTGVRGRFRIVLTFAPDTSISSFPDRGTPDASPVASTTDLDPGIFTAIQEQLGLKLQSARGPVEVIVIDHVEKASEN